MSRISTHARAGAGALHQVHLFKKANYRNTTIFEKILPEYHEFAFLLLAYHDFSRLPKLIPILQLNLTRTDT